MSDSTKKYPRSVRGIYVAGIGGEEGRKVEVDPSDANNDENGSQHSKKAERELRALALAGSQFFSTYLELHNASNEQAKDGSLKDLGKNAIKAHKAGMKVLQTNSKAFDHDPSEIHDNIVEYIEDLQEEYEKDED